jgi:hypothetical protein
LQTALKFDGGITGDSAALLRALTKYVSDRRIELVAQQGKFEKEYFVSPEDKKSHVNAIACMKLGVPMGLHALPLVLNQQIMFVDNMEVKPLTPLAQEVLVSRYVFFSQTLSYFQLLHTFLLIF